MSIIKGGFFLFTKDSGAVWAVNVNKVTNISLSGGAVYVSNCTKGLSEMTNYLTVHIDSGSSSYHELFGKEAVRFMAEFRNFLERE